MLRDTGGLIRNALLGHVLVELGVESQFRQIAAVIPPELGRHHDAPHTASKMVEHRLALDAVEAQRIVEAMPLESPEG